MHNNLDRDLAKQIKSLLAECLTLVTTINDNKYVPHIVTQPEDCIAAVASAATFTVVANNVSGYQWQYKATESATTWSNSGASGNKTATVSFNVTEARYDWRFRCQITGMDGSVIYTDTVKAVPPNPDPEPGT